MVRLRRRTALRVEADLKDQAYLAFRLYGVYSRKASYLLPILGTRSGTFGRQDRHVRTVVLTVAPSHFRIT